MRVLIVGAGIAGQTLACALARRGLACDVIELRSEFDIIGAGMYMQANALRAFDDIGVVPAIHAAGYPIHLDHTLVADVNGQILARLHHRLPPDEQGRPILVPIQRRALHDVLARAVEAAGVAVRMGCTVEAIDERDATARVTFTDGTHGDYDLVVGADGIHSRVRQLVYPGVRAEYSGYSNWRVLLPRPAELVTALWLMGDQGRSFGMVPLSADTLYIAGVTKEPGNPRINRDDLARLMRERFAQFERGGGLAGALLAQVTHGTQVVYTAIEQVELPAPWHRGRVVVLGDAAHASTPFWAQGAAMAIEDAVVLARELAQARDAGTSLAEALARWQVRRTERCLFVQRGSLETGRRSHSEDPGALEARYAYLRSGAAQTDLDRRLARLAEPI